MAVCAVVNMSSYINQMAKKEKKIFLINEDEARAMYI